MVKPANAVITLSILISAAHAAEFIPLGFPPGEGASFATGVSGDGSFVAGWGDRDNPTQAFRWSSGGGMQLLGDLPGGYISSFSSGLSADGTVVVGSSHSGVELEAFRWENGVMLGLGFLPGHLGTVR